jgi:hypothetical protein
MLCKALKQDNNNDREELVENPEIVPSFEQQ